MSFEQPNKSSPYRVSRTSATAALLLVLSSAIGQVHAEQTGSTPLTSAATQHFAIQPQPLANALLQFSRQTGLELLLDDSLTTGLQSPGVDGTLLPDQALMQLLAGSGLTYQLRNNTLTLSRIGASQLHLGALTVEGQELGRDEQGYNAVYDENYSSVYAGKEQIERYKGASPADLFKGMANVYSGDARNSGAVDPNIRGIQGPGRIVTTVDGTEQALTVWRGYNGANNRNYIDPNMIGGIQVIKGPNHVRDARSGIGGAVVMSTISPDDVLKEGETWGGELKLEGSNNTIKEKIGGTWVGRDYRDIVEEQGWDRWPTSVYVDPNLYKPVRSSSDNKSIRLQDQAFRLALATKQERFEALAAYAYRDRGNYFAGKNGSSFYTPDDKVIPRGNFVPYIAHGYKPGNEIPNTSSEMESWLLKASFKPADGHKISAGYSDMSNTYGEIMPSRISWSDVGGDEDVFPQWPLSEVKLQTVNLGYEYNPENNQWIDFHAKLWMTDADSNTYTPGGFPSYLQENDFTFDRNRDQDGDGVRDRDPDKEFLLIDTAFTRADHSRKGVSISNKINIMDNLSLTLAGDFQYEKLQSKDEYYDDRRGGYPYKMLPRSGRRQEHEYNFNFAWQPVSMPKLSVSAGARTTSYWIKDDFRARMVSSGAEHFTVVPTTPYRVFSHYTTNPNGLTQAEIDAVLPGWLAVEEASLRRDVNRTEAEIASRMESFELRYTNQLQRQLGSTTYLLQYKSIQYADSKGKFDASTHPYLNGDIVLSEVENFSYANDGTTPRVTYLMVPLNKPANFGTVRDSGKWVPFFSVGYDITDKSKVYLNYSEALRMPSMFEGTIGFSASMSEHSLEPEHAKTYELGYAHDLSGILGSHYADFKIAYFRNKTKNVMERDFSLLFTNIEQQTIAGWELQGRYDSGLFWSDLSLVYNQKNEVCDEHSAVMALNPTAFLNPSSFNKCVDYGFSNGYLATMVLPKYSANLAFGTRLFNDSLEIGSRLTWHYKHDKVLADQTSAANGILNAPFSWDNLLLVDGFINYKVNQSLGVELVGTNLTNRYYIDPLSRSYMPAPGRTFKLALTANY